MKLKKYEMINHFEHQNHRKVNRNDKRIECLNVAYNCRLSTLGIWARGEGAHSSGYSKGT